MIPRNRTILLDHHLPFTSAFSGVHVNELRRPAWPSDAEVNLRLNPSKSIWSKIPRSSPWHAESHQAGHGADAAGVGTIGTGAIVEFLVLQAQLVATKDHDQNFGRVPMVSVRRQVIREGTHLLMCSRLWFGWEVGWIIYIYNIVLYSILYCIIWYTDDIMYMYIYIYIHTDTYIHIL